MDDSSGGPAADRKSTPLPSKGEAGRVTGSPRLGKTHHRATPESASDFAIFTPEDQVHDACGALSAFSEVVCRCRGLVGVNRKL
jgi:hypothetical protein